ncbi:HD domain-containing phosphohydrolase [Marinithermus hydrothermalis]|uniref:HD domain-containing phosphohydrolase n=1 Tax=Marinithermus hydrothermalis TaxID=186192 RepID=UPI00145C76E4|nr:HD domain-containing phosphohydrolase [Marinithermus hydrothermalis]
MENTKNGLRLTYANPPAQRVLALPSPDTPEALSLPLPESLAAHLPEIEAAAQAERAGHFTWVPPSLAPPQVYHVTLVPLGEGGLLASARDVSQPRTVLEALHPVKAALAEDAEPTRVYHAVLHAAMQAVPGSEGGSLWIWEGEAFVCRAAIGFPDTLLGTRLPRTHQLEWYGQGEAAFLQGAGRILPFPTLHCRISEPLIGRTHAARIKVNLAVPIVWNHQVRALLNLDGFTTPRVFSPESLQIAELFAREAAAYLAILERERTLTRHLHLLEHLIEAHRRIRNARTLEGAHQETLKTLQRYTRAGQAFIAWLDSDRQALQVIASTDPHTPPGAMIEPEGLEWTTTANRPPQPSKPPRLTIPITNGQHEHTGVLIVPAPPESFTSEEVAFIRATAETLGLAAERIEALNAAEERAAAYKRLLEFSSELEIIEDPDAIAQRALQVLLEVTACETGVLFRVEDRWAYPHLVHGKYTREFRRYFETRKLTLGRGAVGIAIQERKPLLLPHYDRWAHAIPEMVQIGYKSVLVEPLWVGDAPLGALALASTAQHAHFTPEHQALAQMVARRLERAFERVAHLADIETTREATFRALGIALERRDFETRGHTDRVVALTAQLGEALGFHGAELEALRWGAYLHDIGKLAMPDEILLKPDNLVTREWHVMQTHPEVGYEMLKDIPFLPEITRNVVRYHHERWDGSGYPEGLQGEAIPLEARIFTVVDVFDALTNERPYKPAWSEEKALAEIQRQAGRQFDPRVAQAFVALRRSVSSTRSRSL